MLAFGSRKVVAVQILGQFEEKMPVKERAKLAGKASGEARGSSKETEMNEGRKRPSFKSDAAQGKAEITNARKRGLVKTDAEQAVDTRGGKIELGKPASFKSDTK